MKIINSIEKPFRQAKIEVLEDGVLSMCLGHW